MRSEQQKQEALQNHKAIIKKRINTYWQFDKSYIDTKLGILSTLLINGKVPESHRSDSNLQTLQDFIDPKNNINYDFNTIKKIVISALFNKIYNCCKFSINDQFFLFYSIPQILAWFYREKIRSVIMLDLHHNSLEGLSADQWTAFWVGVKISGITSLNLAENELSTLSADQWTAFLAGIKISEITSLNLSENTLGFLGVDKWVAFSASIKISGITSLDLSGNDLYFLHPNHWMPFKKGLADSNVINLTIKSFNHLTNEIIQELEQIIDQNNKKAFLKGELGLRKLTLYTIFSSEKHFLAKEKVSRLVDSLPDLAKEGEKLAQRACIK